MVKVLYYFLNFVNWVTGAIDFVRAAKDTIQNNALIHVFINLSVAIVVLHGIGSDFGTDGIWIWRLVLALLRSSFGIIVLYVGIVEKFKTILKELAVPYGRKKVYSSLCDMSKLDTNSKKFREYFLGEKMNNSIKTIFLNSKVMLMGGKFSNEFTMFPDEILNTNKARNIVQHRYTVMTRGEHARDTLLTRYLVYFSSYVDLPESISAIQPSLEEVIIKKVQNSGKIYANNEIQIESLEDLVREIMEYAVIFRYLGPYAIKDKELVDCFLKSMDRTSIDIYNENFYSMLFRNGDVGKNYIYEYIELESKRRKYLPEFGKPMDIIQFLVDNSSCVEENVVKMGFQLQRVIETGIMIIANRLYNLIIELSIRHEECKELLEEQLSLIEMNNGSTHISFEMLDEMVLLDAFIKECLRMSGGTAFMLRISTQDVVMSNGVTIPKNGYVCFNIQSHNRNPKLFGPNANSFDYKRHIRLGMKLSDASLANLIWGAGGRICLARLYSVAIVKLVMAILIRNFEFFPNYRSQRNSKSDDFDTSHYAILSDRNKTSGLYAIQRPWKCS